MDNYSNVEIGIPRAVLRIFGMWPKGRNAIVHLSFAGTIIVMVGFCNIPQTVKLFRVTDNFDEVLEIITNCNLTMLFAVVINLLFWSHHKDRLLDAMTMDWANARTEMDQRNMRKNAKLSRLVTIIVLWSTESSAVSFLIMNANISAKEFFHQQSKINVSERWRPMYMPSEFAYDVQRTPYYEITWILQCISTFFAATTVAANVGFFSTLVLHLCAQMKNLRGQFEILLAEATHQKHKILNLSTIVERHEFLMMFAETIKEVFSRQFLVQLLLSILIFCLTGYQIVKIVTSDVIFWLNLIFAIYYYICFAGSLFINCLIATALNAESTRMREAAYNSEWYELSPANARLLILIMIRTRQPIELTAGKFVALSLDLYCSVMKTSGGYLSMLLAVKDRLAEN